MSSHLTRPGSTGDFDYEEDDEEDQEDDDEQEPTVIGGARRNSFVRRPARPAPRVPPARSRQSSPVKIRGRRRRSRPLTPDIVIERRSHHSFNGHRIMRIPLDNRPTLGLRGPPKRFIEIERVPCRRRRRRRKCHSPYAERDFVIPSSAPAPVIAANPLDHHPSASSADATTWFANLTADMIENLPRRTIHLPPIYLPGCQATAQTPLQTVVFPAEIINPIDGSLSVIRINQTAPHDTPPPPHRQQAFSTVSQSVARQLSHLIQQSVQPLTLLTQAMTHSPLSSIPSRTFRSPHQQTFGSQTFGNVMRPILESILRRN